MEAVETSLWFLLTRDHEISRRFQSTIDRSFSYPRIESKWKKKCIEYRSISLHEFKTIVQFDNSKIFEILPN